MINILIISHGELAKALLHTAEVIIGRQNGVETLHLSQEESLATLCQRTGDVLESFRDTDGILVLTDMLGGTPCNASLPFSTTHRVEIVSGVNLYMLISAMVNRKTLSLEDLARKVISDGQKNIANAKEIFLKKLK